MINNNLNPTEMNEHIEDANTVLQTHSKRIVTIKEWSDLMGKTCEKTFSRNYRECFGIRPKQALIIFKIMKFGQLVKESPTISGYELALELHFKDERGLYKFVKAQTGLSIRELKAVYFRVHAKIDREKGRRKK